MQDAWTRRRLLVAGACLAVMVLLPWYDPARAYRSVVGPPSSPWRPFWELEEWDLRGPGDFFYAAAAALVAVGCVVLGVMRDLPRWAFLGLALAAVVLPSFHTWWGDDWTASDRLTYPIWAAGMVGVLAGNHVLKSHPRGLHAARARGAGGLLVAGYASWFAVEAAREPTRSTVAVVEAAVWLVTTLAYGAVALLWYRTASTPLLSRLGRVVLLLVCLANVRLPEWTALGEGSRLPLAGVVDFAIVPVLQVLGYLLAGGVGLAAWLDAHERRATPASPATESASA